MIKNFKIYLADDEKISLNTVRPKDRYLFREAMFDMCCSDNFKVTDVIRVDGHYKEKPGYKTLGAGLIYEYIKENRSLLPKYRRGHIVVRENKYTDLLSLADMIDDTSKIDWEPEADTMLSLLLGIKCLSVEVLEARLKEVEYIAENKELGMRILQQAYPLLAKFAEELLPNLDIESKKTYDFAKLEELQHVGTKAGIEQSEAQALIGIKPVAKANRKILSLMSNL